MDKLPVEVLHTILEYAKIPWPTGSRTHFFSCLLCCRLWYDISLPLMYKGIYLRVGDLHRFLTKFSPRKLAMVKFLTISATVSRNEITWYGRFFLGGLLRKISTLLPKMINLSTLSFTYNDSMPEHPRLIFMCRSAITELVKNLPTSCVNLEIDTHGLDKYDTTETHLCDALRDVLPRLQHLRLRLANLCPGIFAPGFNLDGTTSHQSIIVPVVAPFLKTLVINCYASRSLTEACGTEPSRDAHIPLLRRLCEFASRGSFPAIERLWLVYKSRLGFAAPGYLYYKRCDIIQNQAWCIPFVEGNCYRNTRCFMRTPEGQEAYAFEKRLEPLVEEQTWRSTLDVLRVPSANIMGLDIQCVPTSSFESVLDYQKIEDCDCPCHELWRTEQLTGVQYLVPVQRGDLLDESPMTKSYPW